MQDRYRSMDARQRRGPEPAPEPVDKWFGILAFNSCIHSKRPEWCVSWQGGWSRISRIACIFLIFPSLGGKYSIWINLENGQTLFDGSGNNAEIQSLAWIWNHCGWLGREPWEDCWREESPCWIGMRQDSPCHVPVPYTTLFCRVGWCVVTVFFFWRRVCGAGYHV